MSSPNFHHQNRYVPISPNPMSFPPPSLLVPNQFQNYNPLPMNRTNMDNIFLNQNSGLVPNMAAPNYFGFPSNLLPAVNQIPTSLPYQYHNLQQSTPLLPRNHPQFPYNNMPQPMTNSFNPVLEQNPSSFRGGDQSRTKKPSTAKVRKPRKNAKKQKQAEESSENGNIGGSCENNMIISNGSTKRKRQSREVDQQRNVRQRRSSTYRGVSKYTGRYEAFVWDNTDLGIKPRTVYIGGYDDEESAARAYDLGALKIWGIFAPVNFPINNYTKDLTEMQFCTKSEYFRNIRRRSRGFAKGASIYRGVSRNSDLKKWQARIGKGKNIKGIYLGSFDTEEEAARAYDVVSIRLKGENAITNFDINEYDVEKIVRCPKMPIGKGVYKLLLKSWGAANDNVVIQQQTNANNNNWSPYLEESEVDVDPVLLSMSAEDLQTLMAPEDPSMLPPQHLMNYFPNQFQFQSNNPSTQFQGLNSNMASGMRSSTEILGMNQGFNFNNNNNVDMGMGMGGQYVTTSGFGGLLANGSTPQGMQQPFEFPVQNLSSAPENYQYHQPQRITGGGGGYINDQNPSFGNQNPSGGNGIQQMQLCHNFPGLLTLQGQGRHNSNNRIEDYFTTTQQNPIHDFQTNADPLSTAGDFNTQVVLPFNANGVIPSPSPVQVENNQIDQDFTTTTTQQNPNIHFQPNADPSLSTGDYNTELLPWNTDGLFDGVPSPVQQVENNNLTAADNGGGAAASMSMIENTAVSGNGETDNFLDISYCFEILNALGPLCL